MQKNRIQATFIPFDQFDPFLICDFFFTHLRLYTIQINPFISKWVPIANFRFKKSYELAVQKIFKPKRTIKTRKCPQRLMVVVPENSFKNVGDCEGRLSENQNQDHVSMHIGQINTHILFQ